MVYSEKIDPGDIHTFQKQQLMQQLKIAQSYRPLMRQVKGCFTQEMVEKFKL